MSSKHGVDWATVQDELQLVLSQPLEQLITAEDQLLVPAARGWDIPEGDRRALTERGLPRLQLFTPRPQPSQDPVLMPNLAGPYERRLAKDGQRLYDLGFWGRPDADSCVVGVVPGEGRVLCLLPGPITIEDIPEVLRPYNAGVHKPAVSFLNSSVGPVRRDCLALAWSARGPPEGREICSRDSGGSSCPALRRTLYASFELVVDAV